MPSVCPVEEEFNNFPFVKWRFFEKHSKMDLNNHRSEIEQFLSDLRDHLRYSIEPAEYENTVSLFGDSSEYQNRKFLDRCEKILGYFTDTSNNNHKLMQNGVPTPDKAAPSIRNSKIEHNETEEISYLEMSSTPPKKGLSTEYIDFQDQNAAIKSPLRQSHPAENGDNDEEDDDDADEENKILDKGIYDICNESPQSDDGLKSHQDSENVNALDCPYAGLPACHLSIQKSNKYGQLQRIEKRLFFDQSKKCYCGILSDWLLCYCDGVTSLRPSFSVHLKAHGVEVEHHGEGKRREICFQITTSDPNKKHVFQCNTEVEAKEWIHAIEAAIRGDCTPQAITAKSPRKLPTPPTVKKTYIDDRSINNNDCIYEEPSPLYNMHQPTELLIARNEEDQNKAPEIPEKQNSKTNIAKKFDYDIPKSPPPPVNAESETAELLDLSRNNSDFQNKVKDVHSKLSSQLSTTGPNSDRLKKIAKKTVSSDSETSALSPQQILPTPTKEQKKAIKTAQKLSKTPNQEKTSRNWFLNRLNKSTSSTRSSTTSPTKCKQSEKENLLNNLEICDGYEGEFLTPSNGTTPIKGGSKVNMIINQFEASGHLAMFNVETYNGGNSEAKLSSFCDSDCNNYEPIMTGPSSFMKKV